jgi:hypothetical protein
MLLKIKIYKETYPRFYELLLHFYGKLLPENIVAELGEGSYRLWAQNSDDDDALTLFRKTFGFAGQKFWQNRVSLYRNLKEKEFREENAFVMIKAFKLMGFEIPKDIKVILNPALKARILYQFFLEEYMSEYFKENKEKLLIYNHGTNTVRLDDEWATVHDGESYNYTNADEIEAIAATIHTYLGCISNKDYSAAFLLLSKRLKKSLTIDLAGFKKIFIHTIGIDTISVFDIRLSSEAKLAGAKVHFLEEKNVFKSERFGEFSNYYYSDLKKLFDQLSILLGHLKPKDRDIEILQLKDLLDRNYPDNLISKLKIEPQEIERLFPIKEQDVLARLGNFFLIKIGDSWFIDDIENNTVEQYNPFNKQFNLG